MGTTINSVPMKADDIILNAGLLNSDGTTPDKFTITLDGAVSAAASSLTVQALGGEVRAGTYLSFVDATTGGLKVAYVTADAAAGATTISVGDGNSTTFNGVADAGIPFAIADASTAVYPPELFHATDSSIQNSPTTVSGQTYNSGGVQIVVNTGNSFSLSIPLFHYAYDNGADRTLRRAALNLQNVTLLKQMPADVGYTTGQLYKFQCTVSYSEPSASADVVKSEFTLSALGLPTIIEPVAA